MYDIQPVFQIIKYVEQSLGLADQLLYLLFYKSCVLNVLVEENVFAEFYWLKGG